MSVSVSLPNNAIYPGTFDPITRGHSDLIERAARLFDRVIVALAANPGKQPVFTLEERLELAHTALAEYDNVEICPFDGLLVEFARTKQARVILRAACAQYPTLITNSSWQE